MPRPRFENLDPARRAAILGTAAEEFAQHGYEAASYNRIIERSGLSKGAIYYYFDDKEDLYATVLRDAMQRLIVDVGDVGLATDAGGFWERFEVWYVRSLRMFQQDPHAVGLARGLLKALSRGAASGVLADLRRFARSWMEQFIAHGSRVGAIRSDLPPDLLVAVLMGVEEGVDLWLGDRIGGMDDEEIATTAAMLTRLYRGVASGPAEPRSPPPSTRTTKKTNAKKKTKALEKNTKKRR